MPANIQSSRQIRQKCAGVPHWYYTYFFSEVNQKTWPSGLTIILSVHPCSSVAPGTRPFESSIKRGLAWSRSTLLHQRSCPLADLLKRLWLVRIKNTCLSGRSHSSKSDLVSSLGLASGRALPMRSEFRLGLPCRREFARVAAQIFSGTLNSIVGDRYA